jgi:hypothetical protein
MTGSTDITFVLTSCGRFDLLVETRRAFLASNTAAISRYVIVEDSGDPQISDVFASFDVRFELLINDPPRGQMASIDPAYSGVHTPYIFHCEQWFKRNGMGIASLEWPACETTGHGRHVHDEFAPASLEYRDRQHAAAARAAGGVTQRGSGRRYKRRDGLRT